jgi:HAD superfamily hydrolase (TIGR01549 family)
VTGRRIQGVIFDLDGTLYSLSAQRLRMALKLWNEINILRHVSEVRSQLRGRPFDTKIALKAAFFEELGRRARVSTERAESWYENRFFKSFVELLAGPARLRPGLFDLLSRLKGRDVKLAVVSDYDHMDERLGALGSPLDAFDDVLSAEDFGALKPSPRPLEALAEKWGIEPGALLVVGDRSDLDEKSAGAAGMGFLGIGEAFLSWQEAVKLLDARTGCKEQPGS